MTSQQPGMLTSVDVLGPEGSIAARLSSYEDRPQQLRMAQAVEAAIADRSHLVVEAGTGVGKSFSYLVPAILSVTDPGPSSESGSASSSLRRIIISTHTINLQQQLLEKDIPLLNSVIPREFTALLVKGRGNYISLRRLRSAVARQESLLDKPADVEQLQFIDQWSRETTDGSRSDLAFGPAAAVWDEVASDSSNCMGRKCPTFRDCFYYRARRRTENAQILVVNHALFFSDLALRRLGASILPDYEAVILDEAHTVEDVAADHLGLKVTSGQLRYNLNRLYNDRTNKGLLVHFGLEEVQRETFACQLLVDEFFGGVQDWLEAEKDGNGRIRKPRKFEDKLSPALDRLAGMLRRHSQGIEDETNRQDLISLEQRLNLLSESLVQWHRQDLADMVYWVEASRGRRQSRVTLAAAPVDVGPLMRKELFDQVPTVVMTSATLSVGEEASFDFFKSRIGLSTSQSLRLGSPFQYHDQLQLVLVNGVPDPSGQKAEYTKATAELVKRYVQRTDGRALVLLTSYDAMRQLAREISPWLMDEKLELINQAEGTPRARMIEKFKENPRSVLLGTDSFWQGIDIPGDALQNVIIPRLPFSVPDQPLLTARLEKIRAEGGNPFMDFQLPEAVIKFRQGFGRLIRTRFDHGMVVVLDPRIRSKPYGRLFLESLPGYRLVEESYP